MSNQDSLRKIMDNPKDCDGKLTVVGVVKGNAVFTYLEGEGNYTTAQHNSLMVSMVDRLMQANRQFREQLKKIEGTKK